MLGSGDNVPVLFMKGGAKRVGAFPAVSTVTWGRVLGISECVLVCTIPGDATGVECCQFLGNLHAWGQEVVIFRDGSRVWEGPIVRVAYKGNVVTVTAWDVLGWSRRRLHRGRNIDNVRAVNEMDTSVAAAFTENTLAGLGITKTVYGLGTGDLIDREVEPWSQYHSEDIDSLLDAGANVTTVGRRIVVFPDEWPLGKTATLWPERHLATEPEIVEEGLLLATRMHAVNDKAGHGQAGGSDPYYGVVERSVEQAHIKQPRLAGVAGRNLKKSYPTPVLVSVPDGSTLDCNAPVTLAELVPGVTIPVRSDATCRPVALDMILTEVQVTQGPEGEAVQVTIVPADNAAAEGLA